MKNIKKGFLLIFLLSAIFAALAACGKEDQPDSPETSDSGPSGSVPAATAVPGLSTPDKSVPSSSENEGSQPPREGMVRSRLTNEWVDPETASTRPIAVMTPNETGAIPHYSLSEASVIYEANVEKSVTRMMAVYENWKDLKKIGNVRSLRTYYAYWAFEWDAFLVYLGGPFFIDDLINEPDTQNIDGILYADSAAFFRETDRSSPHNAYASGPGLADVISRKGYPLEYRGLADDHHFIFADESSQNTLSQYDADAKNATYIDMSGCYPLTRCYFEYNEEDGLYYRSQHLSGGSDEPHIDQVTGQQLAFKNIIVQYTKYEELGEGYLAFQCHDTTRDGWFFTNGRGIHVNWKKTSDYGATRYYDDNGNEVVMNTGKTMICIVRDGDQFTFR